jgi:hypothetical protein
MKTLFTAKEAMVLECKSKQVKMDITDETTLIMVKHALHNLGIGKYVELEFDEDCALLRIFELEG